MRAYNSGLNEVSKTFATLFHIVYIFGHVECRVEYAYVNSINQKYVSIFFLTRIFTMNQIQIQTFNHSKQEIRYFAFTNSLRKGW